MSSMRRGLFGTVLGLLLGALLGGLLAYTLFPRSEFPEPTSGWTSYPTIHDVTSGATVLWQHVQDYSRYCLFQGLLFGGGFGAVVGAILGASSALVAALRSSGR